MMGVGRSGGRARATVRLSMPTETGERLSGRTTACRLSRARAPCARCARLSVSRRCSVRHVH
eukprot:686893-Pyramimonas_sp.AAC.1